MLRDDSHSDTSALGKENSLKLRLLPPGAGRGAHIIVGSETCSPHVPLLGLGWGVRERNGAPRGELLVPLPW